MICIIVTIDSIFTDLMQTRTVPTIAAKKRSFNPQLLSLASNQADLGVISWDKNRFWIFTANLRQLSFEIDISRFILQITDNCTTHFFEGVGKSISKTGGVSTGFVS